MVSRYSRIISQMRQIIRSGALSTTGAGAGAIRGAARGTTSTYSGGGGGGGGAAPAPVSSIDNPTPSASELTGTPAEREAQIQAFRTGGMTALVQERQRAEARIRGVELARQLVIEQARAKAQAETSVRTASRTQERGGGYLRFVGRTVENIRTKTVEGAKDIGKGIYKTIKFIAPDPEDVPKVDAGSDFDLKKFLRMKGDTNRTDSILEPENVVKGFGYLSGKLMDVAEFLGEGTETVLTGIDKATGTSNLGIQESEGLFFDPKKNPIPRETAERIGRDLLIFTTFSPLISTATTQRTESEWTQDLRTGKFVRKADVKDYLEGVTTTRNGKVIRVSAPKTYGEKALRLRDLLGRATTLEQKKQLLKIAEETFGKTFLRDFVGQEYGLAFAQGTTPTANNVVFQGLTPVKLKNLQDIGATVSLVEEDTSTLDPSAVGSLFVSETDIKPEVISSFWTIDGGKTKPKTRQDQRAKQDTKTGQDLRIDQIPKQDITPEVDITPITTTTTKTKTRQKTTPLNLLSFGRTTPIEKGSLIPLLRSGEPLTTKKGKPSKPKQQGYIPQALSKGKWKNLSKESYNKRDALALARWVVDNTTSARGRLVKSKKAPVKRVFPSTNTAKFRDFKIVNGKPKLLSDFGFIEKKSRRIDTRGEKRGLTVARLLAQKPFGLNSQSKKKKKRRKSNNLFFR